MVDRYPMLFPRMKTNRKKYSRSRRLDPRLGPREYLQREGHRHGGWQSSLPLGPDERGQGGGRRHPQDHRQEQMRGRRPERLVHPG